MKALITKEDWVRWWLRHYLGRLFSISGFAVALSSIAFMAYVFFVESIFGHYVLYYEPDRWLAFAELLTCIYGSAYLFHSFKNGLRK